MNTTMTALDRCRTAWEINGLRWRDTGPGRASAQAPGHSDRDLSASFTQVDGAVLVHFHAGEDTADALAAVGLTLSDLYDTPGTARYTYPDGRDVIRRLAEDGKKRFTQRNARGRTALYRTTFTGDGPVYVVEGEKDVHAAEAVGAAATCSAMGAGKAHLADWTPLRGRTVVIVADKDEPGRRHAQDVAEQLDELKIEHVTVEAAIGDPDSGADLADHIAAGHGLDELIPTDYEPDADAPRRQLVLTRASEVKIRRVRWLMDPWVLLAGLTLLAGREGLGKSTIAVNIAAQLTRGELDGELSGTPGNVLYVATEDDPSYTVAPRFKAAGADLDRVYFLTVRTAHGDDGRVVLPMDLDALEQAIIEQNITMIVLDAATSVMDASLDGHDDRKVRQFLEPVAALAQRTETAILGIVHFGKRDGADTGKLILGSVAWSQVARSVLAVAADRDTGNLVMTNTKKNLAPETRSVGARIVPATVETEDGHTSVGRIEWLGETDADARELLAAPEDEHGDDRSEIARVVQDYLIEQGGSAPAGDVLKATRAAGLSDNAVKKHRRKAGVTTEKNGFGGGWVWTYDPGDTRKMPAEGAEGAEDSAEHARATSGHLRESSASADPEPLPAQCTVCGFGGVPDGHTMHHDCARESEHQADADHLAIEEKTA